MNKKSVTKFERKHILIYGCGTIGSLFACYLSLAGHRISVYARGNRLIELQEKGLRYNFNELVTSKRLRSKNSSNFCAKVQVRSSLDLIHDPIDYVFLTVRYGQVPQALREIENELNSVAPVVIFSNNLGSYGNWQSILENNRLIIGFPGAGGFIREGILYGSVTPSWLQKTTIGEISGIKTRRCRNLIKLLNNAQIPSVYCSNMKAWQLTHVALILPLGNAFIESGSDNKMTARNSSLIKKITQKIQSNLNKIRESGERIIPRRYALLRLLPEFIICLGLKILIGSSIGDIFMYRHVKNASSEIMKLNKGFEQYFER